MQDGPACFVEQVVDFLTQTDTVSVHNYDTNPTSAPWPKE